MPIEEKLLSTIQGNSEGNTKITSWTCTSYTFSPPTISVLENNLPTRFLGVNTAIIGAVGYLNSGNGSYGWAVGFAGVLLCVAWYRSVRAYKDLNYGKLKVIHALETKLPVSLCDAEWDAVGRGKDPKLYLPFTRIEVWIPRIFLVLHLAMILLVLPWNKLVSFFCG